MPRSGIPGEREIISVKQRNDDDDDDDDNNNDNNTSNNRGDWDYFKDI
jgi:hypothetical protein